MRISDWSSDGCSSNLFGALGLGGVVALLLGMAILIDVEAPGFRLSWAVVGTAGLMSLALLTLLLGYVVRARRAPARTGTRGMLGLPARVLDLPGGTGHVMAQGEPWRAPGGAAMGGAVGRA